MDICEHNDFLQKVIAGEIFSDITNLPKIQTYLRQSPKHVYLDTSVLLHILCHFIHSSDRTENSTYASARDILRYRDRGAIPILLSTTTNYVRECAYQLKLALQLIPFTELPFFGDLGESNNVFYKYYRELIKNGDLVEDDDSFRLFLSGIPDPGDEKQSLSVF